MCDLETQFVGLEWKGINFDEFKYGGLHENTYVVLALGIWELSENVLKKIGTPKKIYV